MSIEMIADFGCATDDACARQHPANLPRRAGIGLKAQHFAAILQTQPDVGFFEIHAENYMVAGGPFHRNLHRIRERYALSLHGVGLSIGGEGALDEAHLTRLADLIDRYQPAVFSEHLAWSSHGGCFFNDLLPIAYDARTLRRVCEHVDRVQTRLKRRMLLENPSTYLAFAATTLSEPQFIAEVVRRTGCGLLLDLNNLHVSCVNNRRDLAAELAALPLDAVGQVHLAGFARDTDAAGDLLLIDHHGSPVDDAVWTVFGDVTQRLGALPTLIERDNDVPALEVLVAEAMHAECILRGGGMCRHVTDAAA